MANLLELHVAQALAMTEKQLQARVNRLAAAAGWTGWYHTGISVQSAKGFPDCIGLHPQRGMLARELKVLGKRPTPEQAAWLAGFTAAGIDAGVWTSLDLLAGLVEAELTGRPWRPPHSMDPRDIQAAVKAVRAIRRSALIRSPHNTSRRGRRAITPTTTPNGVSTP